MTVDARLGGNLKQLPIYWVRLSAKKKKENVARKCQSLERFVIFPVYMRNMFLEMVGTFVVVDPR